MSKFKVGDLVRIKSREALRESDSITGIAWYSGTPIRDLLPNIFRVDGVKRSMRGDKPIAALNLASSPINTTGGNWVMQDALIPCIDIEPLIKVRIN